LSSERPAVVQPQLVALSGPLKGQTFTLQDEFSIGRSGATLALGGPFVSRRHCLIEKVGLRYVLRDLDSHNGTAVNGERISERLLDHGDQIHIGNFKFLVVLSDEEIPPISADIEFVDQSFASTHTFVVNPTDVEYFQPGIEPEVPADRRSQQDLATLLQIAKTVNDSAGLASLQARLTELMLKVVPADAAAILLVRPDGTSAPAFAESVKGGGPVIISRSVVDRVLRERTGILINDIDSAINGARSLVLSAARAVVCVPLLVRARSIGAFYMVRTKGDGRFDDHHLEVLTAIASMASLPLETARQLDWLESENRRLRTDIDAEYRMIGNGTAMQVVYNFISRVAATDSTVLICGESGTGKELVARAIHRLSARARMPFIAINCGAIAETLVESELFGHEKGAFTSAISSTKGKFEVANGGTIFLDEIGELPQAAQVKLLRVLEEQELHRVGNPRPIKINVRVIAATNRNLDEEIRNGRFRKDLFFRLNVLAITLPRLQDRREDIPELAKHFVAKLSAKCNRRMAGMSPEALSCLLHHDWPGNVRELENTIERAIVLADSDMILPEDLPEELMEANSGDHAPDFHNAVRENKRYLIIQALKQCGGNRAEAAKLLGLNRTFLHRLIRNLQI
jgi:transcriptional regulator with GAF, ATPase, and Fis domain